MDSPRTIFKYQAFNLSSIRNLKSHSIYFASPKSFNDPYDCAINAPVADLSSDDIERIRKYYLQSDETPLHVKAEIARLTPGALERTVLKNARFTMDNAREGFLESNGVSCFTEKNDDLVMWSHYGGQHRGFCLEFRTEFEPFSKLRRVSYKRNMPRVNAADMLVNDDYDQFVDLLCTKSSSWEYEREWRVLHAEAGTQFTYEPRALKAIYFGSECTTQDRDLICSIMYTQNPDVQLFGGALDLGKFQVSFTRLFYEPPGRASGEGRSSGDSA